MEKISKLRTVTRSSFTRLANNIEAACNGDCPDLVEVQSNFRLLQDKFGKLQDLDTQYSDLLMDDDVKEEDLIVEAENADKYACNFYRIKTMVEQLLSKQVLNNGSDAVSDTSVNCKRKIKLPVVELKQFDGNVKNWLPFWSQFKRIDKDEGIDDCDKFQYLVQATVPGSKARQFVESFPLSDENYPKVIEGLKSRFGRDDVLVEVYVRELLKLVLHNLNGDSKLELAVLYDKMEAQLRALSTLGVTSDKCAAMLYPLVESCLPEEFLRVWQRSAANSTDSKLESRLEEIMSFLKKEVENEEKIALAVAGFDLKRKKERSSRTESIPTAAELINCKGDSSKCLFCGDSHVSEECVKARSWSFAEKAKMLREKGLCYRCLKKGHLSRNCRVKLKCRICKGQHVEVMCSGQRTKQGTVFPGKQTKSQTVVENSLTNNEHVETFLQTLVVKIRGQSAEKYVRAIIDTGSQRSYICTSTAKEMNYEVVKRENVTHALFGGILSAPYEHNCYRVRLTSIRGDYACNFEAMDQPNICDSVTSVTEGPWLAELKRIGVEISDRENGPVEVLIGADIAGKIFTGKKFALKCGLVAMETLLGWILMGKVTTHESHRVSSMIAASMFCKEASVADLWKLDVLGITDPGEKKSKIEAQEAVMDYFERTLMIDEEGRYEVKMPWVEGHPHLPSNLEMCKRRLDTLVEKLKKDDCYEEYCQVFNEWLEEGIVEEVSSEEIDTKGHYLPHRHVVKLNSETTRIRPVFDASAREKGYHSLNQCLEKGINLIEIIPSILTRFRLRKLGVVSDIRKAFLQISLCKSDRDFLRFLWIDEKGDIKVYRHKRVVFGVSCSPFLLCAVIEHHLKQALKKCNEESCSYSKDIIAQLLQSFYVDNCVTSVNNAEELHQFIEEANHLMADAKFELRGWEYTSLGNLSEDNRISVLGLVWETRTDNLELRPECFQGMKFQVVSKRVILSTANRIFDPIGITSPVTLYPKILLQETWLLKLSWDEEVPEEMGRKFRQWVEELHYLKGLVFPRWIAEGSEDWSLHVFCDASEKAYAAVVFLRTIAKGQVKVQLVQAKSRVAPIKKLTIPRLELMAALIGVRLAASVTESLDIGDIPINFWTDSTTVLAWIRRNDPWNTFVGNRVREIRTMSKRESWNYVPGIMNCADLPSRGCSPKRLMESKWWEGPLWLKEAKSKWPEQRYTCQEEIIAQEKKKTIVSSLANIEERDDWYYHRFSRYEQIVRLIGWIRRFIFNCRHPKNHRTAELSIEEVNAAEKVVIRLVQRDSYVSLEDKKLKSLCPFEDKEQIIRLKTKILGLTDKETFRCPAVLPSSHPIVKRLIYYKHIEACHAGVQGLMSILREQFWILKGRKTIRSVVKGCVICQRHNAKRLEVMPVPLPEHRVRDAAVFEITGVDLAGPVILQSGEKAWICIFTCAVYRAVHLELTSGLSSGDFIQSFRRFIARRGRPLVVYSDNGTNFVGTENLLSKLEWEDVVAFATIKRIEWRFNPPTAAWWGGWWERLIRLMKQLLRKILGKASLTYEEFITVLCDCEAVMNARPLTYISEDNSDLESLTPSMFLQQVREVGVPDLDEIQKVNLHKRWKYCQRIRETLRSRFRSEYLGQLVQHWNAKSSCRKVKVGEVVLVGNDNSKRLDWPLARIVELIPGRDGEVRLVRLRTATGIMMRPLQRVFPLEIQSSELPEVPKLKNTKEKTVPEKESAPRVITTRLGRRVNPPQKLSLLVQNSCYEHY